VEASQPTVVQVEMLQPLWDLEQVAAVVVEVALFG
jgi:hypothetical protein